MSLPPDLYATFLSCNKVEIDSRKVTPESLFFGLRGTKVDGNDYAGAALEQGAIAAVVDNPAIVPEDPAKAAYYQVVPDTMTTLQNLATYHREQCAIPVLVIAGSNGKTTTKALVEAVLSQAYSVHATPGNWNNYLGLPLTILQLKADHQVALLELGANQPGEYELLCRMAQPTHGLITNIGKDHLEGYGDYEGVVQAHKEVVDSLKQQQGTLFLNAADQALRQIGKGLETIAYGPADLEVSRPLNCVGHLLERAPSLKMTVEVPGGPPPFQLNTKLYGGYNFLNALAAAAVGHTFKVAPKQIKAGIERYEPANNRSQVIQYKGGTVILDAYNANPSSMREALNDFDQIAAECRMAVLGDMHEMGAHADHEHRQILELLTRCSFRAVMVGPLFYQFTDAYPWPFFPDKAGLWQWWQAQTFTGCYILIKGSRGLALETLVED